MLLISDMLTGSVNKLFEEHCAVASNNMSEKLKVSLDGTVLSNIF